MPKIPNPPLVAKSATMPSAPKKRGRPPRPRTPDLVFFEALAIARYHEARTKDSLSGPDALRRVVYNWEYGAEKLLSVSELEKLLARDQPAESAGPAVVHELIDPKEANWHSFRILDLVTAEQQRLGRSLTDREYRALVHGLPRSDWLGVPLDPAPAETVATKLAGRPRYPKPKPKQLKFGRKPRGA